MKKILICLFLVGTSFCLYAQQIFIKKIPLNEKVAVAFTEPTPSVLFFGLNDASPSFIKHKINNEKVNAYFGAVDSSFPIFNISDENIVEYNNSNGHFFFYRPNTKKKFGIIISNGKDQPIIETNPDEYLNTIKTYLNISSADDLVTKTLDERNAQDNQQEMELILTSTFIPDKNYSERIIETSNTVHYVKPSSVKDENECTCKNRVFEMFSDSLCIQKTPQSMDYIYNDQNQLLETINYTNGKANGSIKYIRNPYGLIEKMITDYGSSVSVTQFVYEKDKFHTVYLEDGRPNSFETFYLNDQMQCYRRLSKRSDQSIVWDINYIFDKFGRLVSERQADQEMIYNYKNDTDDWYLSFDVFSLNPRILITHNEMDRIKYKQVFTGKNGAGKQTFKSVTITEKDCATKTYGYDANNKFTYLMIIKCK